jgi:succinate dehydrogenase hydrophobic anchor subunit
VIAVAVHAATGMRNIMREWWRLRGLALSLACWGIFIGLLATGLRAVYAVVGG